MRLLAVTRLMVDPIAVQRVLEPLVADWQREWLAAPTTRRRHVARVRGMAAFLASGTHCLLTADTPRVLLHRTRTTLILFVVLGIVIAALPIALWADASLALLVWWVPSFLLMSVVFAALPVAMQLGANGDQRIASRRYLLQVALAISVVTILLYSWIVPYSNQAWRERAAPPSVQRPVSRGVRELTLPELFSIDLPVSGVMQISGQNLRQERHTRVVFLLMPSILTLLGWSLGTVSGSARTARLMFWWTFSAATSFFASGLGIWVERYWSLPRETALWLPLALWCAASAVLMRSTRNAMPGSHHRVHLIEHGSVRSKRCS